MILGFDWRSLPPQSVVVDVGGGIGSTSMLLATAFSAASSGDEDRLKFIIQDRAVVCEMGEQVWSLIDEMRIFWYIQNRLGKRNARNCLRRLLRFKVTFSLGRRVVSNVLIFFGSTRLLQAAASQKCCSFSASSSVA
jgi:hypothetical protein